ncbi:MAG TPA: OmpA family protein [Geomonas sp.]|nr:OmpA family protein [Geomonas sp.]
MKNKTWYLMLALVMSLFVTNFLAGCATMEKSPPERKTGWLLVHKPLGEASHRVDAARAAGKDRECPAEFKTAKDEVDQAYAIYAQCRTEEAKAMAQDAINKLNALCPAPVVVTPVEQPHYKYCVTLHIEFDIDKAEIRPEYRPEVAKVGDFMKKYPTTTAIIEGHTDNVGTAEHNMDLSQRRAQAVVDYLADNFGIDRSRLTAKGYGMSRPVADNSTEAGKQKNRRIEAIIDCAFDVTKIEPPEKLCMQLNIQFDTNSYQIKEVYKPEVAKVADYMKQYPETTAIIEGHTDNVGNPDYNMKLSQQRAQAVVDSLVKDYGIDASRLSAKGYGDTRQVAYNSTPEGRAMNRRIDAVIDCVVKKP